MNFETFDGGKVEDSPASLSEKIARAEKYRETGGENNEAEAVKEKLKQYAERIENNRLKFYLQSIDPEGSQGRTLAEELDLYEQAKAEGTAHEVRFSYPHVHREGQSELESLRQKLEVIAEIRKDLAAEENPKIGELLADTLDVAEAKIDQFLALSEYEDVQGKIAVRAARQEDTAELLVRSKALEDQCFAHSTRAYGALDGGLVRKAQLAHAEKNAELEQETSRGELEEILVANKYDAVDIAYEFNRYFARAGLTNCLAVVDATKHSCITSYHNQQFEGKTVVKIPAHYEITGLRLIQLINHESMHVIAGEFQSRELGLGTVYFGQNASAVQEGIAVLGEMEVSNAVFGSERLRSKAHPYFVLAMEEIRRRSREGQEEVNPGEIYDFIYGLIQKDFARRGSSEAAIVEQAQKILRRVYRGVPGNRHYCTRDSIYFRGEELAKELKEAGKLGYVEKSHVDPELIPLFLELGIYDIAEDKESLVAGYKSVLKDIIKQEDWDKLFLENRALWRLFGSWEK